MMATRTRKQLDQMVTSAQYAIEYEVEGSYAFPFDMLRYDLCWPATEADSGSLDASLIINRGNKRRISMKGLKPPTVARWASFGWTVWFPGERA